MKRPTGRLAARLYREGNRMRVVLALLGLAVLAPAPVVRAQAHEPEPRAMRAFREMVTAYRKRPALAVKTTVSVELVQDDVTSSRRERRRRVGRW